MSSPIRFADPRQVDRPEDCFFYHRLEVPGLGVVGEQWDLRACIDDYLGRFDFRGKRVLDVGTAGGYLTFAMEQRGAEVVSFDMADGAQWDIVPHIHLQSKLPQIRSECRTVHQRLQNAYWYTHKKLGSKARAYYGNVYDLPAELGTFDVAVFGMIVSHLQNPFQALYSASRLVTGSIIVTNEMRTDADRPLARFIPSPENKESMAWWLLSQQCLEQMLAVLGFKVHRAVPSRPLCMVATDGIERRCTALVAQRVAGKASLPAAA